MTITVYTFEDKNGHEYGTWHTQIAHDARQYAAKYQLRVIANEYEFADSEPVEGWDFTADERE